jgi:hypothetical protein
MKPKKVRMDLTKEELRQVLAFLIPKTLEEGFPSDGGDKTIAMMMWPDEVEFVEGLRRKL